MRKNDIYRIGFVVLAVLLALGGGYYWQHSEKAEDVSSGLVAQDSEVFIKSLPQLA